MSTRQIVLGHGGEGPWENRTQVMLDARVRGEVHYPVAFAWLNATYSVQLLIHPEHADIDHLLIRRHDEGTTFPWTDLQKLKDRLLEDGQFRWAYEAFPPTLSVVDNANLRHLWVMPRGWSPPIDLRDVQT